MQDHSPNRYARPASSGSQSYSCPKIIEAEVLDEASLVEGLRTGNNAAFESVVRELGPRLLAVARSLMGNEADAQDALQDAFLSAVRSIDRFSGESKLSTWLHRIVVNACLMRLRTKRRRPEESLDGLGPTFHADGHRRNPGPAWIPPAQSGIEAIELRRFVRTCINQLPETYRVVLMLRDVGGLDTEATANALNLTTNAVKTRLHRARQALRELIEPRMIEAGIIEPQAITPSLPESCTDSPHPDKAQSTSAALSEQSLPKRSMPAQTTIESRTDRGVPR